MSPQIAAKYKYSLLLIKRKQVTIDDGTSTWNGRTKTYRGRFKYNDVTCSFGITDPVAKAVFKNKEMGEYLLNDVYLCLSLTKPYNEDGRCHKLIAAVLTNPPLPARRW